MQHADNYTCVPATAQSVRVEVWHRCPRGGAAGASGQRELLLGTGSAPLLDVLRKQQVGGQACSCL